MKTLKKYFDKGGKLCFQYQVEWKDIEFIQHIDVEIFKKDDQYVIFEKYNDFLYNEVTTKKFVDFDKVLNFLKENMKL